MIEIDRQEIKPEFAERHFTRMRELLELNISRSLMGKAEAGTIRSERGYQLIAASVCGSIARAIGCSEDKAKALCMAVGLYFPKYGHEGLKVVKQYILEHNIDLDVETLGLNMISYYIQRYNYGITTVFYDLLHDYFNGIDSCEEIKIVHLVQDTIMDIKKAEHFYDGEPGQLLFDATQELVDLARKHEVLMKGTMLDEYRERIKDYQLPRLTEEERHDTYNVLDRYIESFTHHKAELAKYDKTPEEAVLIYIDLAQ